MERLELVAPGRWRLASSQPANGSLSTCVHFGEPLGRNSGCSRCPNGKTLLKLFRCRRYGSCTPKTPVEGVACCVGCPGFEAKAGTVNKRGGSPVVADGQPVRKDPDVRQLRWSIGVTSVPERRKELLPQTLASLQAAGFPQPRLFVDGAANGSDYDGEVTLRWPRIKVVGNWILALWELYIREPVAHRYAIFQDDLLACRNLRAFLERSPWPSKGYVNLYNHPENERIAGGKVGWHMTNQLGRGAVGLVFDRDGATALLSSKTLAAKPIAATRPDHNMDGCISDAMREKGYAEWFHFPSLLDHTGKESTVGPHHRYGGCPSFPGTSFDALSLLPATEKKQETVSTQTVVSPPT